MQPRGYAIIASHAALAIGMLDVQDFFIAVILISKLQHLPGTHQKNAVDNT